ncbi:hypothetical protein MHU86_21011 [Fragilaria crotonensis]|nr:hypothetical protein MHU86_21011 [Fragilaria crotonensis]
MSAKRKATAQSGKSALKKQAGRPTKKHCIDDAVRMVIDKDLLYDEAIWACRLFDTVTRQTLRYHVRKELERRMMQKQEENGKVGMYVAIGKRDEEEADTCNGGTDATEEQVSPLTTPTTNSSTEGSRSLNFSKWKEQNQENPKQANQERIDAKQRCHDGTAELINKLNLKYYLIANGKRKLAKSTVYCAIAKGIAGKSPLKKGPPPTVPSFLVETAAVHAEVCQAGKGGELKSVDIKRTIGAAILGTHMENAFKVETVWRKMKREYPEKLQPVKLMSVDDSRAQWTTFTNLQQWFNDVKTDIINTGLVLDQEVRDPASGMLISELDFRSDEVRRRFVNMDETHHDLSVTGDRGGPRAVMYHNPQYQRGCRRSVKSSRHVTGVYATNAAGEVLPPMFIFDSNAKTDENFRVKNSWLEGLPTITGRFGCPTLIESSSFYAVRSKGSMDDSLLNSYIEDVLLPLYPNINKTASFDATGKLLAGPVVLKLDSGPGRIVASHESILKREGYFERGLIILAGLPNATSVQQEMDALYGPFKSATYSRGEMVVMRKIKERGERQGTNDPGPAIVSLGFEDLSTIVDGNDGDDVSMRPFSKCFTTDKVLRAWNKIGFVPFTRKCLYDKKVRHELGQDDANVELENLQEDYAGLVSNAESCGASKGVFNASIERVRKLDRAIDEDEQVRQLVATRGAFLAGSLWTTCKSRVGNCRVTLRAQREQMAIDEAKANTVSQNRLDRQAKLLANAQTALQKFRTAGAMSMTDKDWGDVVRWVLPEAKVSGLMRDLKKKEAIIAKLATLERDWTTYIPAPTEL